MSYPKVLPFLEGNKELLYYMYTWYTEQWNLKLKDLKTTIELISGDQLKEQSP